MSAQIFNSEKSMKVIIAEKPSQGVNIAEAFALTEVVETVLIKKVPTNIKIYTGEYDNSIITLIPAKGHIIELRGRSSNIIYFGFEWKKPTARNKDKLGRFNLMKKYIKMADEVIIATDADDEGELIGYNILKYFNAIEKSSRMLFMSLTVKELQKSYANRGNMRINIANAAEMRSWSDKTFGYIFSKFLTKSYLSVVDATYMQLPVGRVMTPLLSAVVERIKSIERTKKVLKNSKPKIRINFELFAKIPEVDLIPESIRLNEECKDINIKDALLLKEKYDNLLGVVVKSYIEEDTIEADYSGSTIDEVREWAYENGIDYVETDSILEVLYLNKLITYPRSESTLLPDIYSDEIDEDYFELILDNCLSQLDLEEHRDEIIVREDPLMGVQFDGAHYAIHPTNIKPKNKLPDIHQFVYDYIMRKFVKGFSGDKIKNNYYCDVEYTNENITDPIKHKILFWQQIEDFGYECVDDPCKFNHEPLNVDEIPIIEVGTETYCMAKIKQRVMVSVPLDRFTKEELYKFLKDERLGTDATRSIILQKLWNNNLLRGNPPFPTILGTRIVEAIKSVNVKLTKTDLTREFEENVSNIKKGLVDPDDLKYNIKEEITEIIEDKLDNMVEIGNNIAFFGSCQKCDGRMKLVSWVKNNKSMFFLACEKDGCGYTAPI